MARPRLTAEQLVKRKEQERLRSQHRRRAAAQKRQTELLNEVAQTPAVRVLRTEVANPTHTSNTISNSKLAPQTGHVDDLEGTKNTGQPVDTRETATLDGIEPREPTLVISDLRDRTDGRVSDSFVSSPSPSFPEPAPRYNFRTRKSPTPTNHSLAPRSPSSATDKKTRPESVTLPLRPIANGTQGRRAPVRVQSGDEELHAEPEPLCHGPAPQTACSASTRRVQQCRARQRSQRRGQHILDASQQPSQVRVISLPYVLSSPAASVAHTRSEREPEPDRRSAPESGNGNSANNDIQPNEALVQSTIVVANDEVLSPSCRRVDDAEDHQRDHVIEKEARQPGGSLHRLNQEQDLFVSDDDDDVGLPGGYDSEAASSDAVTEGAAPSEQQHYYPSGRLTNSVALLPLLSPTRMCLEEAVTAIASRESPAGLEFIARQSIAYRRILQEAFSVTCDCKCLYRPTRVSSLSFLPTSSSHKLYVMGH
jgi:hypothetical protein